MALITGVLAMGRRSVKIKARPWAKHMVIAIASTYSLLHDNDVIIMMSL